MHSWRSSSKRVKEVTAVIPARGSPPFQEKSCFGIGDWARPETRSFSALLGNAVSETKKGWMLLDYCLLSTVYSRCLVAALLHCGGLVGLWRTHRSATLDADAASGFSIFKID